MPRSGPNGSIYVAGCLGAIAIGLIVSHANLGLDWKVLANLGATAIVAIALIKRRESLLESPLTPMLVVVTTSGLVPAALGFLDGTPTFGISADDYAVASTIWLLFVAVATVTYSVITPMAASGQQTAGASYRPEFSINGRLMVTWLVSFAVALAAAIILIRDAGGLGTYIDSLNERSQIFAGKIYLKALLAGPAIASLVFVAANRPKAGEKRLSLVLALVTVSTVLLLLTGSREQPVAFLAAVAIVYHYSVSRLSLRHVVIGLAAVGMFGLAFSGATRGEKQDQSAVVNPVDAWGKLETTGPISDFGQMASVALISQNYSDNNYQYGRTYIAAATIFVPSSIAPWKLPAAGAVASERILPSLFDSGTALQTAFPGEGFMNFGWLGVVLSGVFFGWLMKLVRGMARPTDVASLLLFALILPRIALLFREDLANVTGFLVLDLVVLVLVLIAAGVPRPWFKRSAFGPVSGGE